MRQRSVDFLDRWKTLWRKEQVNIILLTSTKMEFLLHLIVEYNHVHVVECSIIDHSTTDFPVRIPGISELLSIFVSYFQNFHMGWEWRLSIMPQPILMDSLSPSHTFHFIWIVSFAPSFPSGFWLGSPNDLSCTNCLHTWPSPILSYESAQGSGFHDYLGSATIFTELGSSKVHIWAMASVPSGLRAVLSRLSSCYLVLYWHATPIYSMGDQ